MIRLLLFGSDARGPAGVTVTMYRFNCILVFLACVIAAGLASPASQSDCSDVTRCTVSNLDIDPCPNKERCLLVRKRNATITFDFLPDFSATELETEVSYRGLKFVGLESNACLFTTCPVTQGVKQSMSYNLYVTPKLPQGTYPIKWKLWNKANPEQLCCFETKIKIPKVL